MKTFDPGLTELDFEPRLSGSNVWAPNLCCYRKWRMPGEGLGRRMISKEREQSWHRQGLGESRNDKSSGGRNSLPTWIGVVPQSPGFSPLKGVGHPGEFSSIEQWCRCFVSFRSTEMHHEEIASESWASSDSTIQLQKSSEEMEVNSFKSPVTFKCSGEKKTFYQERQRQTCIE